MLHHTVASEPVHRCQPKPITGDLAGLLRNVPALPLNEIDLNVSSSQDGFTSFHALVRDVFGYLEHTLLLQKRVSSSPGDPDR